MDGCLQTFPGCCIDVLAKKQILVSKQFLMHESYFQKSAGYDSDS